MFVSCKVSHNRLLLSWVTVCGSLCYCCPACRGATTAEKLMGPRFGPQHWSACASLRVGLGRGSPLARVWGYYSKKIFENSEAKFCILVTTCCESSCFLKTTAKKLGTNTLLVPLPTVVAPVPAWHCVCCCVKKFTFSVM